MGKTLKCLWFPCCSVHLKGFIINFVSPIKKNYVAIFGGNMHQLLMHIPTKNCHIIFFSYPVRWQMSCHEFHHYCNIFSDWKEMIKPPKVAPSWFWEGCWSEIIPVLGAMWLGFWPKIFLKVRCPTYCMPVVPPQA